MDKMRWCRNCLEPDTRPGQIFDDEGLCTPCHFHKFGTTPLEWEKRRKELAEIVEWSRQRRSRSGYDCVIGVSGGKDSTCLALFARQAGMNPLLVSCTYPPQQMSELGAYDLSNLVSLGFDLITVNIAPEVSKRAMRISFLDFGNWCKPTELALYASIPRIALSQGISLACAGENPFLAFGNECGSVDGDASNITKMHTLGDGELDQYFKEGNRKENMMLFRFPEKDKRAQQQLRMVYLGYYMEKWGLSENAEVAKKNGLKVRTGEDADPARTGSYHDHTALDEDFVFVNQYLKYLKFGFGQTAQQVSDDIRYGRAKRQDMIEVVRKYDGRCDESYIKRFIDFIGISEEQFREVAERARNLDLWEKDGDGWRLKYPPV